MKNSLDDGFHDDCTLNGTQNGEDDTETNQIRSESRDVNQNDYNALEDPTAHEEESDDEDEVPYIITKLYIF